MPVLYLVESSGSVADMSFNVDGIQFLTIVPERKGTRKGNHFLNTFQQILSVMSIIYPIKSAEPRIRKFGYLCIRENLIVT